MFAKKPLQSKKFIAYLIADLGWKISLFYILYQSKSKFDKYSFAVIITLLIISGFVQVGYILGQAALDKYVNITENLSNSTKENK